MEYVIENLQSFKEILKEEVESLELSEHLHGWTPASRLAIGIHKERIKEVEKAIMILVMHDQALNFMVDWFTLCQSIFYNYYVNQNRRKWKWKKWK